MERKSSATKSLPTLLEDKAAVSIDEKASEDDEDERRKGRDSVQTTNSIEQIINNELEDISEDGSGLSGQTPTTKLINLVSALLKSNTLCARGHGAKLYALVDASR